MTDTPSFATLAAMAFDAREGYGILDGEIFHALFKDDGSFWTNDFVDDIWHRRDAQDPDGFEGPPAFSRNAETALTMLFPGCPVMLVLRMRPDAAGSDWRPWLFEVRHQSLGRVFTGTGHTAALAICNAIMQAHSAIAQEAS